MLKKNIAYVCPCCETNITEHEFNTLQGAIDWIGEDGEAMIILCHSLINVPKIKMNSIKTIKIDGRKEYGIKFADDLLDVTLSLSENQTLNFTNMSHLECEKIIINANNTKLTFNDCKNSTASLVLTSGTGTKVEIIKSNLTGFTNYAAIEMNNINTEVEIYDSVIQGSSTKPAIYFSVASNKKIKIKKSTILHGTSRSSPIQTSGSVDAGIFAYNCVSNCRLDNANIINWIVNNNNNIVDQYIDF